MKNFSPNIDNKSDTNNTDSKREKKKEMNSRNVSANAKIIRHWLKPTKGRGCAQSFTSIYAIIERSRRRKNAD